MCDWQLQRRQQRLGLGLELEPEQRLGLELLPVGWRLPKSRRSAEAIAVGTYGKPRDRVAEVLLLAGHTFEASSTGHMANYHRRFASAVWPFRRAPLKLDRRLVEQQTAALWDRGTNAKAISTAVLIIKPPLDHDRSQ